MPKKRTEHMLFRRSNVVLAILLFLLAAIVVSLNLVRQRQDIRQRAAVEVALFFEPASVTLTAGDPTTYTATIMMESASTPISQVKMYLDYDPQYVEVISIDAGTDDGILIPLVPYGVGSNPDISIPGTAFIELARLSGGVATGGTPQPIATLTIRPKNQLTDGVPTEIVFDHEAVEDMDYTLAKAEGEYTDSIQSVQPLTVNIVTGTQPSPSVSPQPTPTPQATPTPAPTPTPGATPTPYPSATPSPLPTPTPNPCGPYAPPVPTNVKALPWDPYSVLLTWNAMANTTHYGVVYGLNSGSYIWSKGNVGNVTGYVIGGLTPATTYYAAVYGVNDCGSGSYSGEVSAKTSGVGVGGAPVYTTPSYTTPVTYATPSFKGTVASLPPSSYIPFLDDQAPPPPDFELPDVSIEPEITEAVESKNFFLTPLGGILLIVIAIFLLIFLIRMRRHDE